jgi:hypothetical protein
MEGGGRRPRAVVSRARAVVPILVAALLFIMVLAVAAARPRGENVHRRDGDCRACHTADAAALNADVAAAKTALAGDLEARCLPCHGDQGPSHRTGMRPKKSVPPDLPLAADGTIGCATCHFMHGENDAFGDFLRRDNRRGGLCLSCHELSELQ